jgi:hypothetical protein
MSRDARLNRLMPALSARERATMVLRNFKEKRSQDHRLGEGMTSAEAREYNRLIRLMNACNLELLPSILTLSDQVEMLDLRIGWLVTLEMWSEHAEMVELYLKGFTKEPITESGHRALLEAEPQRWAPVSELAHKLTARKHDWREEQIEDAEGQVVYAEAWEEERERQTRRLTALVRGGAVEGKGRGKDLRIRVGSFYSWLGEDVRVRPEWGFDYDLAPDDQAGLVEQASRARARVRERFTAKAFPAFGESQAGRELPFYRALGEALKLRVKHGLIDLWAELLAENAALDEVAQEFGEDVLKPASRADLDRAQEKLQQAHTFMQELMGDFELPEVKAENVTQVREYIQYFAERG